VEIENGFDRFGDVRLLALCPLSKFAILYSLDVIGVLDRFECAWEIVTVVVLFLGNSQHGCKLAF
jgi:hypothetical protein